MQSERAVIVIPARFASSRLPGKPLADILGKPMIRHVWERAREVPDVAEVIVATDDGRVAEAVLGFGGRVEMTSEAHPSGTDRMAEVMSRVDAEIYVNIQGDEPMVRPADIATLITGMRSDPTTEVGTLCHAINAREARDPNIVKAVLANNGDALYFSRAPIPYPRDDADTATYLKHVGVYAYRRDVLARYASLRQPMLELAEKLEQLRLLAAGVRIRAYRVEPTGPGVDTPEGLEAVRMLMSGAVPPRRPRLEDIRLIITDIDGVLTDGGLYYDGNGEALKRFHVRDGLGIQLLDRCGIQVAFLSGRDSSALRARIKDLGVRHFALGVSDKRAACRALMEQAGVPASATACIGDDSIDLPAFAECGYSVAVASAASYVRNKADHVLSLKGGDGAFREFADAVLAAQGKLAVADSAEGFLSVASGSVRQ